MRVNRLEFLNALESTRPGITNQEVTEQSNCFLFSKKRVWTFNEEVACSIPLDIDFEGAVPAAKLTALLAKLPDEEILIQPTPKAFKIKGKARRGQVAVRPQITMPVDQMETPTEWTALPEEFVPAIDMVRGSVSTSDAEFLLTCVHLTGEYVEAADNVQLSRYRVESDIGDALVRGESLKFVVTIDATHVSESQNWIHFRNNSDLLLSCRRYMDEYPPCDDLLEGTGDKFIFPPAIEDAVSRCELFSQENLENNQVVLTLKPGRLLVYGEGPDGWFEEMREIKYAGDVMKFGMSPKILKEIVARKTDCQILPGRLKIDIGQQFTYVGCLFVAKEPGE